MGKQKRSLDTYQKINTIFCRDENNIIMPNDEFVQPEFEFLRGCKFRCEEKIDGTCVRLEVTSELKYETFIEEPDAKASANPIGVEFTLAYKGKTDNAQMPKNLDKHLKENYPEYKVLTALGLKKYIPVGEWVEHKWVDTNNLPDATKIPRVYDIYGEGYGAGIQSGGYYCQDQRFIIFDVKVNDLYLGYDSRDEIATNLGCPVVPLIGYFTIDEAIEFVKTGFNSTIAETEHLAEGLVVKTDCGLKNRRGERIVTKIKTCDFRKWEEKYGNMNPEDVHQVKNSHL